MNKVIIAAMPWIFAAIGYKATAQDTPAKKEDKKETQVITIKKTGDKNTDLKLEFKGDEVLINGKPLIEFKDDAITVNNKKIIIKNGDSWSIMGDNGKPAFEMNMNGFNDLSERMVRGFAGGNRTFLGVTSEKDEAGAKITDITKGSAAEKAGLEKNDIIIKIDDKKIEDPGDLSAAVLSKKAKDEVKITYKRNGKEKTAKATLQERKDSEVKTYSFNGPGGEMRTITVPGYPSAPGKQRDFFRGEMDNLHFSDVVVNGFPRAKLGLKIQDLEEGSGVKVLEVEEGSAAEKAGLKKDDVITSVADQKVENTDDAREELHKNAQKSSYSIEARRNGTPMKFDIKIPKKLKTANL